MPFFNAVIRGNKQIRGNLSLHGVQRVECGTYLFKLTTNSGAVVATPDGAVPTSTRKKLKILIDGVVYYFLAATDWVNPAASSVSLSRSPSASLSPSASGSASLSPSH